jgi:lipopolysaccharide biosynthesis glycosyltransferase
MFNSEKALVTLLNQKALHGFMVFAKSFFYFNNWFDYDFVIFDIDLRTVDRRGIRQIYPNVIFKKINYDNYKKINFGKTHERLKPTFYKLETFSLSEYKRVVFLDMDTVILGNLKELFENEIRTGFAAVRGYTEKIDSLRADFNSGVFVVDKKYLNDSTYKYLLKIARQGFSMPDQKVLNAYFRGAVTWLDKIYNVEKRMEHTKNFTDVLKNAKIIHYVADNPWDKNSRENLKYPKMMKIWEEWNGKNFN